MAEEEKEITERKDESTTKAAEQLIEERKKKVISFFKKSNLWVIGILIILLVFGVYIRSLPMSNHSAGAIPSIWSFIFHGEGFFGGQPGLWDITTNTWTLGPDLDPWLFTRYARTIIEQGSLPEIDTMRNVPLGFYAKGELQMVSYMIVFTYKIVNLFGSYSVNFSAVLMPVILFALTIVSFFLFVREVFVRKNSEDRNLKANIIALISTLFVISIPIFLSRTVAGIPEKESIAFFFMFLTFYLFLKAMKSEKLKFAIILGIFSGIVTTLMGMSWGGVSYLYVAIAVSGLAAFVLNKIHKREFLAYSSWYFSSLVFSLIFSSRFSFQGFLASLDTGLAFLVFILVIVHSILWKTRIAKVKFLSENKLPKNILSLIITVLLGAISLSIFFGPGIILEKIKAINQMMFVPVTGRWSQTVAENRQPYFVEWGASFGPFIKGIPVMFWLFFVGSIVLFKNMISSIRKKDAWILTGIYTLFLFGLIFSRYAAHPNIFDGEGLISRIFYLGSAFLLIGALIYYYVKYHKEKEGGFDKIDYEYLFLFSLFFLCLFTARSAVRLIMVLGPVAPIFVSYLNVFLVDKSKKAKGDIEKIILITFAILVVLLSIYSFWNFYNAVKSEAYSFIPNYYTNQWQKAMSWVRDNTPKDAVFAHWWDYGYWVQSIGERATVTDGGNAIVYWNYLTGRLVLTGDNQKDALDFLYSHNTTNLLIDSSDIGKYGAFSIIGSNKNEDRRSWIPVMTYDASQIKETKEGVTRYYQGTSGLDEDIHYKEQNGSEISLPSQAAAILAVAIETIQDGSSSSLKQPEAIFYYEGKQIGIPLKYLYYNKQFYDFDTGLEGTAYIIPKIYSTGQGVQIDNVGAVVYISPRVMRGLFAQIYLLNDPFKKFPNFELVHSEPSVIVDSLNQQGANLNEFVLFNDIQGPIKIWEVSYTGKEEIKPEYLDTDTSKYIDWQL